MVASFKIFKKLDFFDLDVDFSMDEGFLSIEGLSGAGKTTILNCIAGIVTPDSGSIRVAGTTFFDSAERINVPVSKRGIGYLFQNYALFPNMTVRKNILYGLRNKSGYRHRSVRREYLDYAEHIMDIFGISRLADKRPTHISGGEKQRVALVRAMVTKPSMLLLDEPFAALDESTKNTVYNEFLDFKKELKIPTILITHDHREAVLFSDKIIALKEGRIVK